MSRWGLFPLGGGGGPTPTILWFRVGGVLLVWVSGFWVYQTRGGWGVYRGGGGGGFGWVNFFVGDGGGVSLLFFWGGGGVHFWENSFGGGGV